MYSATRPCRRPCVSHSSVLLPKAATHSSALHAVDSGADALVEVPTLRWGQHASFRFVQVRHGGFLSSLELFDNQVFRILPDEASTMDPQQRLLLECGYGAMRSVDLDRASLQSYSMGVFIGIGSDNTPSSINGHSKYMVTGRIAAIAPGRLSYVFGLHGPSAVCDTACSAGLVACHAAMSALLIDSCDDALSASTYLMLTPSSGMLYAAAHMTSTLGRCCVFDMRADGFAQSESCVAVMMSCNEYQRGKFDFSSAVCQNGRSISLTAPNGFAQMALYQTTRSKAGGSVEMPDTIEAAASGSVLGDAIEAQSVAQALLRKSCTLSIHSIHGAFGYSQAATGVTGLFTLLSQILRARMGPNTQLIRLNVHLQKPGTDLGSCTWPTQSVLTNAKRYIRPSGGINSFGFSGVLAHALLTSDQVHYYPQFKLMAQFCRRRFPLLSQSPSAPLTHVVDSTSSTNWGDLKRTLATITGTVPEADMRVTDLGLDSLAAVSLAEQLSRELNISHPLKLDTNCTMIQLVEQLDAARLQGKRGRSSPVRNEISYDPSLVAFSGIRVCFAVAVMKNHFQLFTDCQTGYSLWFLILYVPMDTFFMITGAFVGLRQGPPVSIKHSLLVFGASLPLYWFGTIVNFFVGVSQCDGQITWQQIRIFVMDMLILDGFSSPIEYLLISLNFQHNYNDYDYTKFAISWTLTALLLFSACSRKLAMWLLPQSFGSEGAARIAILMATCFMHTTARVWANTSVNAVGLFFFLFAPFQLVHFALGMTVGCECINMHLARHVERKIVFTTDIAFGLIFGCLLLDRNGYILLAMAHDFLVAMCLLGLIRTRLSYSARLLSAKLFRIAAPWTFGIFVLHQPLILMLRQLVCPIHSITLCTKQCRECSAFRSPAFQLMMYAVAVLATILGERWNSRARRRFLRCCDVKV